VENRWNIKELLVWTTRYFSERGMDNPRLEAELLLAHTLGQDRVQLYADYDRPVNQEERQGVIVSYWKNPGKKLSAE
jgi:release factor glutamine methyltransferase